MFRTTILALTLVLGDLTTTTLVAQTAAVPRSTTVERASLTVTVSGIRNANGQVFIQVWNTPDGFPKHGEKAYKTVTIEASKVVDGTVTTDVPLEVGRIDNRATLHGEAFVSLNRDVRISRFAPG